MQTLDYGRSGWVSNTLAYYDMATITAMNGFIVQAPVAKKVYNTNTWPPIF